MLSAFYTIEASANAPFDAVVLAHDERHLRRKVIRLQSGGELFVDLAEPVRLRHGQRLVLDDGREVEVVAAAEDLYEVRAASPLALLQIAWHLGNRHLPAEIKADRILIGRDHVIRDMLLGLGASVGEVREPFEPEGGAYRSHGHAHHHGHDHHHGDHDHRHAHDVPRQAEHQSSEHPVVWSPGRPTR